MKCNEKNGKIYVHSNQPGFAKLVRIPRFTDLPSVSQFVHRYTMSKEIKTRKGNR